MKAVTNAKSWANYCRQNGFKNIGKGQATRSEGYSVFTLELNPDGTVSGDRAPQPDDVMKVQLADAYEDIKKEVMPLMPVPVGAGLPPVGDRVGLISLHEYRDGDGQLLLCVERFMRPDGDKQCLPWFYFEGEGWVCRDAPEGYLSPLFGNHHNRSRVMIHEGEKAVEAAIKACSPDSDHPWADFLRMFGHCTWKGGAIMGAVGKSDWHELDRCEEVWIMPDNDKEGYEVAKKLRRRLRCDSVYCIHWRTFGDLVPKKWDIADPCPKIETSVLTEAFELYEQATETWFDDDGKPHERLRSEFAKKFSFIVKTGELVENRRPLNYYDGPLFNKAFARFSKVKNLAELMYSSDDVHKYHRPGYNPGLSIGDWDEYIPPARFGRARSDGQSYINMYRPPLTTEMVPPRTARGAIDTVKSLRPFLAYAQKAFPIPRERKTLLRWLAHNMTVSSPEERVHWAVLLISQMEGTGKSTLGNLVRRLVGDHNVAKVEGSTLTDKFTSWLENIQLAIVEEIKEESAFRLSEGLKAKITEPTVSIRRMNTDVYDTDNFMSLLASSNHVSAISIGDKDRRWFMPKVTEQLLPWNVNTAKRYLAMPARDSDNSFFRALWKWFNGGGDRHMLYYMRRYGKKLQESGWAMLHDRPPETSVKQTVKSRSMGEWQNIINNELMDEEAVCLQDVCEWLKEQRVKCPRPDAVADYLESLGLRRMYKEEDSQDHHVRNGRVYLLKKQSSGYITGHVHGRDPEELRSEWPRRKRDFHWLSDRFQGLAIVDREGKVKEKADKSAGEASASPGVDAEGKVITNAF